MTIVLLRCEARERDDSLAQRLDIPAIETLAQLPSGCSAYLQYRAGRLQLFPADAKQSGPVCVDFVGGAQGHRLRGAGELIVKAVKGRSRMPLHVFDATAGLGRDGFILAAHDFRVALFEREPVVAALLDDGLQRARVSEYADVAERMTLQRGDFIDCAEAAARIGQPDIVYLDPMFPHSQKNALAKKEMRLFQQLFAGIECDEARLLQQARHVARARVVVKRAIKAPHLAGIAPGYTIAGKAVRFDVYPV